MKGIREDLANHPLMQAAREVNAYAEKHGLEETCEHYGLKVEDVKYIAEQRALRAIYAFRGINLNLKEPALLLLSPSEQVLSVKLTAAYMDGLVIGVRAQQIILEKNNELP